MSAHDPRDLMALSALDSLAEVERRAVAFIRQAGFSCHVYAFENPGNWRESGWTALMNGYGERWIDRYVRCGYAAIDPIPDYCFSAAHRRPLIWDYQSAREREFAEDALGYGIGAGLSFPIATPAGRQGAFSFALDSNARDAQEFVIEQQGWAALLTAYVHDAYHRLADPAGAATANAAAILLTDRERECLHWAAAGKSAGDTGRILGIVESTVKLHLKNARVKFGVVTTRQLIVRAIALRIIEP